MSRGSSAHRRRITIESRRAQLRDRRGQQGHLAQLRADETVIVCGSGRGEQGAIRRWLTASADVAVRVLAIDMNPLAVLGAMPMLDEQPVENRGELDAKTEQPHPYRQVSDKRPAPVMGASRAVWSHLGRANIPAPHLQLGCIEVTATLAGSVWVGVGSRQRGLAIEGVRCAG
jgi:hypothetical protein